MNKAYIITIYPFYSDGFRALKPKVPYKICPS